MLGAFFPSVYTRSCFLSSQLSPLTLSQSSPTSTQDAIGYNPNLSTTHRIFESYRLYSKLPVAPGWGAGLKGEHHAQLVGASYACASQRHEVEANADICGRVGESKGCAMCNNQASSWRISGRTRGARDQRMQRSRCGRGVDAVHLPEFL